MDQAETPMYYQCPILNCRVLPRQSQRLGPANFYVGKTIAMAHEKTQHGMKLTLVEKPREEQ